MTMKASLVVLVASLGLSAATVSANSFSTLEERMTAREFREAGLDKLSQEELAYLNRWIQMRSLAEGEVPEWLVGAAAGASAGVAASGGDRRGFADGPREEINSRLRGSFNGWRGSAVFQLENGMIWEQAEAGVFSVPTMQDPEVRIRPGMFGNWTLQVVGHNTRVRVRRIE